MAEPAQPSSNADELSARIRVHLAGRTDIRVAILFGSQARGTAHANSDVDLAIVAPGVDVLDLGGELGEALGMELDIVPLDDPPIPLLDRIITEGIVVHESHPGAGAQWRSHALTTLEIDRPWFKRMSDAWLARIAREGLPRG